MITKTQIIARAVKLITKQGTIIFNDKLKDGRRSLKVWGWNQLEYRQAMDMLKEAGCKVKFIKKIRKVTMWNGISSEQFILRLHITE